jgi:L-ribulose-5-phosphate 3-epimerase
MTLPMGLYEKALPISWSWDRRLAAIADAGFGFAEISIDPSEERLARLNWPISGKADLRRAIAASGVPILTMCLSAHRVYSLGSRIPATRERGMEIMRRAIEF